MNLIKTLIIIIIIMIIISAICAIALIMKTEEVVMSIGDLTQYLLIPIRSGKGWVLNWWNKLPKQWSILKDQRGKQLKYGDQGSDPSREMKCKDQQNRQLPIWYVTEADTPAHAKGSPWGHPADQSRRLLDAFYTQDY